MAHRRQKYADIVDRDPERGAMLDAIEEANPPRPQRSTPQPNKSRPMTPRSRKARATRKAMNNEIRVEKTKFRVRRRKGCS